MVRFHEDEHSLTFQVIGWGQMALSLAVRRCAEEGFRRGKKILRFDLRHCSYMDSTFLGTVLFLHKAVRRLEAGQLLLLSPSSECCALLHQLGVAQILPRLITEEAVCEWTELVRESHDVKAFNRTVVDAHQQLADLGGAVGEAFAPVVRCLVEDLKKEKP
jgi:anti-anti-sigma regulatory factor